MLNGDVTKMAPVRDAKRLSTGLLIKIMISFAVITGFVEAAGLLLFQGINWANWGDIEHVSLPIFWIAPIVDVILFFLIAMALVLMGRVAPRLPTSRFAVFVFAVVMFYDWLTIPGRLLHRSALILALGLATVLFRTFRKHEAFLLRLSHFGAGWMLGAIFLVWAGISSAISGSEKLATAALPTAQSGVPNVIVIVVDTLRADHLSGYGYVRNTSPNIDRIAQQGVLFENAISASSWTLPSHASLLTGRYTYEHGVSDVKPGGQRLTIATPPLQRPLLIMGTVPARFPGISSIFLRTSVLAADFSILRITFIRFSTISVALFTGVRLIASF